MFELVLSRRQKTNNVVEGFILKLGKVLLTQHSNNCVFLENIKHIQEEIKNTIIQIRDGHTRIVSNQ